jgi:mRNA interferase MazF
MLVLSSKAFNERTNLIIGLPMTHAQSNETNPFAVKYVSPKGEVCYVLTHQTKSFAWRDRAARPHPWKQVPQSVFSEACEGLNSIISIG